MKVYNMCSLSSIGRSTDTILLVMTMRAQQEVETCHSHDGLRKRPDQVILMTFYQSIWHQ